MALSEEQKIEAQKRVQIDNEGNTYVSNRARRRRKPMKARTYILDYVHVPENMHTKSTAKIKKIRRKNAKTEQQRKRDAARARKAYQEGDSQVS